MKKLKIGKYKIGRYHAIIKKTYEDGSFDYETSFSSEEDLLESVYAIRGCIGQTIGSLTDEPKVLTGMEIIKGKLDIENELNRTSYKKKYMFELEELQFGEDYVCSQKEIDIFIRHLIEIGFHCSDSIECSQDKNEVRICLHRLEGANDEDRGYYWLKLRVLKENYDVVKFKSTSGTPFGRI